MPNIQTFNPGPIDIRPSETGVEAVAGAARRGGAFFNQAAQDYDTLGQRAGSAIRDAGDAAVSYMDHREISHGALAMSSLILNKTNEWNDIAKKADPNDPTVAQKFLAENLEPSLEQFRDGFTTEKSQQWAESHIDALRQHMANTTNADMATLAGHAIKTNTIQTINQLSGAVNAEPSSLEFALKTFDSSVEGLIGSSPNLKGAASATVRDELTQSGKQQIVKSAVMGAIEKNPDAGLALAHDPRYSPYINAAEIQQFAKAAKVQAKSNFLQDKQIETYQRQQDDLAAHAASNKLLSDNVSIDPATGRAIIKPEYFSQALDIAKRYPNAPSATGIVHTALTWGEHQQNLKAQPTASDPETKSALYTRMFDPTNPTTEPDILKAEVEGKIAPHDGVPMRQLIASLDEGALKGPVIHDTLAAVKANLTYSMPGMPGRDPKGLEAYSKFVQDFIPKYQAQVRAGTLPLNALDTGDPASMISKSVSQFKRTSKQMMNDRNEEMKTVYNPDSAADPGATPPAAAIPTIPASMSIADAVKQYGSGKTVRLPDGRTKVLP